MPTPEKQRPSGNASAVGGNDRKPAAVDLFSLFVYVLVAAALVGQIAFVVWIVSA
jgi:nitrate reductase NapE component